MNLLFTNTLNTIQLQKRLNDLLLVVERTTHSLLIYHDAALAEKLFS